MFDQASVIASIPSYLRQFVVHQHYDEYTPQDHAVWRYIMHRNIDFLQHHAHPAYLEGLARTGINIETIPHISEMNERLSRIGWKAVVVDGFVPPAAFMEFQAHKILVISAEIRNFKNILYTPAPDIIHEAAGHAPIIADEKYAIYLQKIGEYGAKSVFSKLDYEIYEAIRQLSIIKEYPDATPEEVSTAERELEEKVAANTKPSEAAHLARLHWWTVEYGLIGSPEDFKIYGAGILSSVGESKACMSADVKKIPLSTACTKYDYDITKMQPQLFVARDFDHLLDVLEEFADSMCFRKGGVGSVRQVIESENVGTVVLSSGLQISGVFTDVFADDAGNASFIRTRGETALAVNDRNLDGHGTDYHREGFSSPVGRLRDSGKYLEDFSDDELGEAGIRQGEKARLEYESGITVEGVVGRVLRESGKVVLISFDQCRVEAKDGSTLFDPGWGPFDLAVGARVVSAYSGSADKENFNVYPPKSEKKAIKVVYNDRQKSLFALYREIGELRKVLISGSAGRDGNAAEVTGIREVESALAEVFGKVKSGYPEDWLIRLEIYELCELGQFESLGREVRSELNALGGKNEEMDDLIKSGLKYLNAM